MSSKTENLLFWGTLVLAGVSAGLLFLSPKDLFGSEETTEFALKTLLYPTVLGFLVLAWKKLDRKIKNDRPGEADQG